MALGLSDIDGLCNEQEVAREHCWKKYLFSDHSEKESFRGGFMTLSLSENITAFNVTMIEIIWK
jgi:hypothetical protein